MSDQLLGPGQTLTCRTSGEAVCVGPLLGRGAQGEVFRATMGSQAYALKWYYPPSATPEQERALTLLVGQGPPGANFLWPIDLVEGAPGPAGFGYTMALRPARYHSMVDLVMRRIDPTLTNLTKAAQALADSFWQLHAQGLCYRDVNFENVFFDPKSGEILICDNDNVGVDGSECRGVLGTINFMAPEIVRGETRPGARTDLHSLAVLLFYMFFNHHPLEGQIESAIKALDLPARRLLYGHDPVFVFDPRDSRNRPRPDCPDHASLLALWPLYPRFLQERFEKTFTCGLSQPDKRVGVTLWRRTLSRLRDSIFACQRCQAENFYDPDQLRQHGRPGKCWSCRTQLRLPPRMRLQRSGEELVMVLGQETLLYPHHLSEGAAYDYSQPVARVVASTRGTVTRLQLRNEGSRAWTVQNSLDRTLLSVTPGEAVALDRDLCISFGECSGEVRV